MSKNNRLFRKFIKLELDYNIQTLKTLKKLKQLSDNLDK